MWLNNWEDTLPEELSSKVMSWLSELTMLTKIKIPGYLQLSRNVISVSLHAFVDASQDAYGAVAYMKSEYSDGKVSVSFVTSKTKVAPLQSTSIPHLELMGAATGKRLALYMAEALNIDKSL